MRAATEATLLRRQLADNAAEAAADRAALADATGRIVALRHEIAELREALAEAGGAIAANHAEAEGLRGELVAARGNAHHALRAAAQEAAELRSQVADLQRRLDQATSLVDSVTRAVAARMAGDGDPTDPDPARRHPGEGPGDPSAGDAGTRPTWSMSLIRDAGLRDPRRDPGARTPDPDGGDRETGRHAGGPGGRDPDAGIDVEVLPRRDPWGRPMPPSAAL